MIVPTDDGRTYVPAIFARAVRGESLNTIARWLDSEGVRPVSGSQWWAKTLADMIRNPVYIGHRRTPPARRFSAVRP